MSKVFALGVALTAKDMFSPTFSSLGSAIRNATKDVKNFGTASAAIGTALKGAQLVTKGAALSVISSFSDLENAQTQLENTLMKSDGKVSPFFKAINDEATKLGNALPGTTADFYQMASKLKALGIEEQSIVGGALKSAAYLGVVLKIPYEEAAISTAKFKEALGIADGDLLEFIDDIQRLAHTGVDVGEMSFAFSKVGATMKGLGLSGLQASREISPLIGMLIKSGFSGETVGTNLGNMIESAVNFKGSKELRRQGIDLTFNDSSGKFLGIQNMIKELEKLNDIESDAARLNVMESLFGKGEAASMAIVLMKQGIDGVNKYKKTLTDQADLNQRIEKSTGTLANTWEALTGTFTNVVALIGGSLAPELKGLTNWLSDVTVSVGDLLEEHPMVTKFLAGALVGFVGLTGALGTAAIAVSMFTTVLGVLGVTSMVTFGWIVAAVVAVGAAIYAVAANWDNIVTGMGEAWNWFADLIGGAATAVYSQFEPTLNWLSQKFQWVFQTFSIGDIFNAIVQNITGLFSGFFSWIDSSLNAVTESFNTFSSFLGNLFDSPIATITGAFETFFNWLGGKFQWVLNSIDGVRSFFGMDTTKPMQTVPGQAIAKNSSQSVSPNVPVSEALARSASIPAQGATSNSVSVTIQNPSFNSPEEARRTQDQIDEQVRRALREMERDQRDRSYND